MYRTFISATLFTVIALSFGLVTGCGKPDVDKDGASGGIITGMALVNEIEILILESFPVQVNVVVRGDLPDACTYIGEVTTDREGNMFLVTITTFRPADAVCAQVITPFEEVVSLDVLRLAAGTYTVDVNGVADTFRLEVDNSPP